MDAEDQADSCLRIVEGNREVGDARPIRRPNLDEPDAGAAKDLRDPDAAADLDELAARHDHTPASAREPDRQGDRGGIVRDDERVLGTGQRDEVLLAEPEAPAAPAGGPVQLEEERPGGCPACCLDGRRRPGRAPEVRVDEHAGGIDDSRSIDLGGAGVIARAVEAFERRNDRVRQRIERPASVSALQQAPLGMNDIPRDREHGVGVPVGHACPSDGQHSLDARGMAPLGGGDWQLASSIWRERMGVEPTARRRAPRHSF